MNKKIQIKHTITDRILEALSLMLTIGTTLYLAAGWDSFPDRIPAHYNAAGEIDRWGTKGEIFIGLVFADLIFWLVCLARRQ